MMTAEGILKDLAKLGNEGIKKTLMRHGAREPFFGVKIEDLKKLQKAIKKDYTLALELFESGISDAMYLAGLIADETRMTKDDLQRWVKKAYWTMLSDYTVAWVAAESSHGFELAREWIGSADERIASAGWCTLSSLMSIKPDDELPLKELEKLLDRVGKHIHKAPNCVRSSMNGFIIAAGSYVASLTEKALRIADQIGKVSVDVGDTACKVPDARAYIEKVKNKGKIGKKRKMARC
jgi:3-methyladenine DNA glycosylase AlkD